MLKNHNRHSLKVSILAAAISFLPFAANAAGLGKLVVLSALGKPLSAELDVSASGDELGSLTAKVAPVEAFRQANIDFVSTLSGLRFVLDKRANGQPYFRITSDRAINDPFLDFLIELNWSSGRLVREYTFLLDPPDMKAPDEALPSTVVPEAKSEIPLSSPDRAGFAPQEIRATSPQPTARPGVAAESKDHSGDQRTVHRGDTLARIASELRPEGVSLDQMLVALFRSNPSAFDGENMNRLRAGKILVVPSSDEAAAISVSDARNTIIAQSADFASYRRRLAASAVTPTNTLMPPTNEAKGLITPQVQEPRLAVPGKDQLQVSRTDSTKSANTGISGKRNEEDLVAREKALKEANSRIAELEKNLGDLKRLAELKNQAAPKAGTPPSQAAETSAGVVAPSVSMATASAPKPPEAGPTEKLITKPPVSEQGFSEANLTYLLGGGGLLAMLAAFFGFKMFKRKRGEGNWGSASVLSHGALSESSVFSGGQKVDTDHEVEPSDSGSVGVPSVAAENVDPLQEAEVYLAYGRDVQAEEILLEALKTTPNRLEIHGKLLEIYAARHSVPQFLTLAEDLKQQTGSKGQEWEHALSLGRVLDSANPLFGGVAESPDLTPEETTVSGSVERTPEETHPPAEFVEKAETVIEAVPESLDFDLDLSEPAISSAEKIESPVVEEGSNGLDFDLDLGTTETSPEAVATIEKTDEAVESDGLDIDFDLPEIGSPPEQITESVSAASSEDNPALDFDLGELASDVVAPTPQATEQPLDFDFDLGASATEPETPALDLSSISLDLDQPLALSDNATSGSENPEVATKLELAQAYQEMGDKDGARELLQEVLKEGSSAQQDQARSKLDLLG